MNIYVSPAKVVDRPGTKRILRHGPADQAKQTQALVQEFDRAAPEAGDSARETKQQPAANGDASRDTSITASPARFVDVREPLSPAPKTPVRDGKIETGVVSQDFDQAQQDALKREQVGRVQELAQRRADPDELSDRVDRKHVQADSQAEAWIKDSMTRSRQSFLKVFAGESPAGRLREHRASDLFNSTMRKHLWDESYGLNYASELLAVYRAKVPQDLHADLDRMISTLEFHVARGSKPEELAAKVTEGHVRDPWRVAGMVLYVFLKGFGAANALAMIMTSFQLTYADDKYRNGLATAVMTILLPALGGTWAAYVAAAAKMGVKYERAVVIKDGKSVELQDHWTGKVADLLSFVGFSIGHPSVDAYYRGSTNTAAVASAKALSAVSSTLLAGLLKGKGPHGLATMDPVLLDARTPAQRKQINQLMKDLDQSRASAVAGSLMDIGKAYKATFGVPGPRAQAQTALHLVAVTLSLFTAFAPTFWPMNEEQAFRFKIAGGILLGLLWGPFHKFARLTVLGVETSARQNAAVPVPPDLIEEKLRRRQREFDALLQEEMEQQRAASQLKSRETADLLMID